MTRHQLDEYILRAIDQGVDYFVDEFNNSVKLQPSSNGVGPFLIRGDYLGPKTLMDIVERPDNKGVTFYYDQNGHQFSLVIKHSVICIKGNPANLLDTPVLEGRELPDLKDIFLE